MYHFFGDNSCRPISQHIKKLNFKISEYLPMKCTVITSLHIIFTTLKFNIF